MSQADLAEARSLPGAAYVDPARFEAERERVVATGWAPVARVSEVANVGDYRTLDLFGAPLVVVRGQDGIVRVLSNVCRHRGMPVASRAGNIKGLMCPYHLWRYGLDGAFASAPAMEGSEAFARDRASGACDLPVIASETWGGWVFANLDGRAAPLGPRLAPLTERLAGFGLEGLVLADTLTYASPWNWKVMSENFLESYHHIGPHSGTLQHTNPGLGTYEGQGDDAFTVLENPAAEGHNPFVVAAIFPLTLLFVTEGPTPLAAWYELDAVRLDRFTLRIHLLAPPAFAAAPAAMAGFRAQVDAIHREDIPACEGVQAGVTSPLYAPGPLSRLEAPLWRFHQHLIARLA